MTDNNQTKYDDAAIEAYINESPELEDARKAGIDLWALWANLHRTPAERLRRAAIARSTILKLKKAKKI